MSLVRAGAAGLVLWCAWCVPLSDTPAPMSVYVIMDNVGRSYGRRRLFSGIMPVLNRAGCWPLPAAMVREKQPCWKSRPWLRRADAGSIRWQRQPQGGPVPPQTVMALVSASTGFEPAASGRENLDFVARCCGVPRRRCTNGQFASGWPPSLTGNTGSIPRECASACVCARRSGRSGPAAADEPGLALDPQGHGLLS